MGMNISEAVQKMREGSKVRRGAWGHGDPTFVVLIPGRDLTASYKPMVDHLGEGTPFYVQDHVDAVFEYDRALTQAQCKVGYQFTQADVLYADWYVA